jgi:nitrile hydratase
MPHDHSNPLSPSGHPYRKDQDKPLTYWQNMEIAVREILISKGITSTVEIQKNYK